MSSQIMRVILFLLAIFWFTSVANAQPADCQAGWRAFQAKNFRDSTDYFTRCLALQIPDEPRAMILQLRAQAYGELKQFELAIADQKASIGRQAPTDVWPHVMLGAYLRDANRLSESLDALQAAMKFDEDGPGTGPGMAVHHHMAQTLHLAKRYQEAIEVMTKGIPKQPDYGYALYQRALAYEALGDKVQAKRDLFRAAELAPKDGYEPEIAAKLIEYGFEAKVRKD